MTLLRYVIGILGLIVVSSLVPLGLARADQVATIYGSGTVSCGTWIADAEKARIDGNDLLVRTSRSWVQGFVSGADWAGTKRLRRVPDAAAMIGWVDNYCREHPLERLAKAAEELVLQLEQQ